MVAQLVKNLPAMQETSVLFLGQEDPLEKGQATHSNFLLMGRAVFPHCWGFPGKGSAGKKSNCNEGDLG